MLLYWEAVEDKKIVEKILISLTKKYDPIVSIIEETKDITKLNIRELMASLQAHEQRLLRHSEKSIESALQSKLNVSTNHRENHQKEANQVVEEEEINEEITPTTPNKNVEFAKEATTLTRIVGFKESHNATTAKSLVMWRRIVDSRINNKQKSLKKKESKACSLQAVKWPKRKITNLAVGYRV